MQQEWTIQSRADHCSVTGVPFKDGEYFYTVLYDERTGFRREDLSEHAWQGRAGGKHEPAPFSFWRSKFELPPPAPAEPLGKQTAEELLRRYMAEPSSEFGNARYILALMLERKRLLKQIETRHTAEGQTTLIYEHVKTGDVFVIPDPHLRLDQMAAVQSQVADMLGASRPP